MQLRKAVCLPRPAGFITFLATGEFVKSNSLNNKITSLCGTHCARQANYSKWLYVIPQTESAIHVITVWYSTFCKKASYNFIDEKQYSDSYKRLGYHPAQSCHSTDGDTEGQSN